MALIVDIETSGADFSELDSVTQEYLRGVAEKSGEEPEAKTALFPHTGEIVSLGVYDSEKNQGAVYFQGKEKDWEGDNIKFRCLEEKDMLLKFWELIKNYSELVGFRSRAFDVPFIIARSIKHKIKPDKRLMDGRYLYQQKYVKHIDLHDQFSFYGSVYPAGNLHMWCRLFGIKSPKEGEAKGSDVARLFKEKKFKIIAEYNARDVIATFL